MNTINKVLIISFISVLFSCGGHKSEIASISKDSNMEVNEKIKSILKIATKEENAPKISYKSTEQEKNGTVENIISLVITDKNFKYKDNETMLVIVKWRMARLIWKALQGTKDLNVNEVEVRYFGYVTFSDGSTGYTEVFKSTTKRNKVDDIASFYEGNPYKTKDSEALAPPTTDGKLVKLIGDRIVFEIDNTENVNF